MTWGDNVSSAVGNRRTTRGTRTVRVGRLDVAMTGAPVWVVIGPVRDDAGSRAGEVLDRMAALGPRFRVGLQPSPDATRWTFTEKPSLSATPTFDISGCTTTQEILDRVVGRPPAAPISVGQAGEHLCICIDHGIGDSHLLAEIVAALSHTEAPNGFVDPLPAPTIDKPVQAAIGHYLKSAPRQVIRQAVSLATTAWSRLRGRADAVARGDEPIAQAVRESQGYRAVFVKSAPQFADELRAWRDATKTRASVTALIMLSIYRALRDAGIPLAEFCEVLVDLRRFLPDEAQTLSNFCTVARVHAGAGTSYEDFSAQLRARAESTGTLVKLAGYAALARAFRAARRNRDQPRRAVFGSPEATLDGATDDLGHIEDAGGRQGCLDQTGGRRNRGVASAGQFLAHVDRGARCRKRVSRGDGNFRRGVGASRHRAKRSAKGVHCRKSLRGAREPAQRCRECRRMKVFHVVIRLRHRQSRPRIGTEPHPDSRRGV